MERTLNEELSGDPERYSESEKWTDFSESGFVWEVKLTDRDGVFYHHPQRRIRIENYIKLSPGEGRVAVKDYRILSWDNETR